MRIIDKLQNIISKIKVQKQLYYVYSAAVFIPILLIGIFLILNSRKLLLEHYRTQVESDNLRVISIMFDVTTTFFTISEEIAFEKNLQNLLTANYDTFEEAAKACSNYDKLSSYLYNNASLSSLTIYTDNPTIDSYEYIKCAGDDLKNSSWYHKASNQYGGFWKSTETTDYWGNTYQELSLIRKIPLLNSSHTAILVLKISNNYLKNRIQNNTLFTVLTINQDPIFFSTDRHLPGTLLPPIIDYNNSFYRYSGKLSFGGAMGMGAVNTLSPYKTNDKLYVTSMDFNAYGYTQKVSLSYGLIVCVAVLIPFIIIMSFTKYFSTRVGTLRKAMHQASMENYNIVDTFHGDDELSQTFSDLKHMIHVIKDKDSKMFQTALREQEIINQQQQMEFKMLASQINPHFLYNTLETIRMKAFTEDNRDVATAIKLLGKSMHYVLENTGTASTTLKKELDYISVYLAIQKLRFQERVNYTLRIPDDMNTEDYQILPLLLQPLVENAILHGLEAIERKGQITIEASKNGDCLLLINISDNGVGMTEEELRDLELNIQSKNKNTSKSIGLYNINQRIKLCYGDVYGMQILSKKDKGTCVNLTLPLNHVNEIGYKGECRK